MAVAVGAAPERVQAEPERALPEQPVAEPERAVAVGVAVQFIDRTVKPNS